MFSYLGGRFLHPLKRTELGRDSSSSCCNVEIMWKFVRDFRSFFKVFRRLTRENPWQTLEEANDFNYACIELHW